MDSNNVRIDGTMLSPFVLLDSEKGVIEISGRSVLSDSESFYKPIVEWIDEYLKSPCQHTTFTCKFDYYNNPCSKVLYTLFRKMERSICDPNRFEIQWYYKNDDNDMLENGEEFMSALKNADFRLISF